MRKALLYLTVGITMLLIGLVLGNELYEPLREPPENDRLQESDARPARNLGGGGPVAAGLEPDPVDAAPPSGDPPALKPVKFEVAAKGRIDPRERMGLPPVMKALREAAHYRPPTRVEQADPILMERYQLERKIHGAYWMTRHELEEAGRFQQDAERAADPAEREFLRKVASQHQALAEKNARQHAELEEERLLYQ